MISCYAQLRVTKQKENSDGCTDQRSAWAEVLYMLSWPPVGIAYVTWINIGLDACLNPD